MTALTQPRWLTLQEAADRIRVNPRTLRRLCTAGRIPPPQRIGRRLLYDPATLDAAIAGTQPAQSDPIMAAINAAKATPAALRSGRPR